MKLSVLCCVYLALCCGCWTGVFAQGTVSEDTASVASGLGAFSLELLAKTAIEGGEQRNVILSSYTLWQLLAILNEGARGTTESQLTAALRLPAENIFRVGYKAIGSALGSETPGIEIDFSNAIFTSNKKPLIKNFQNVAASQYKVNFIPVNFEQMQQTAQIIDSYIANVTRNRIRNFINYDDLLNAQLIMTTAIFFKGEWKLPFNRSATFRDYFYDETMTRRLGQVMMMHQVAPFPYTKLSNLNLRAHALELAYGQDEKYSMIIILPMKNVPLSTILAQLTTISLSSLLDELETAKEDFYDEDVIVYLPRFTITSDFILNVVLEKMGISDVFDEVYANLRKISNDNFYLSRVIHKAKIEVNEEGTVATGVTGGVIANKSPPPVFNATRPFAYLIVEKTTKTVLFVGKYSNPNDI